MSTAPGAPLTGLAFPVSTDPSPSPSHQTPSDQAIEAPRAILTVGRQAIPRASSHCTVAKLVFSAAPWCSTSLAAQVMGLAITAGLPGAVAASIWPNARVNMKDWYCRMASSSHRAPRHNCSVRLVSGVPQAAAAARGTRGRAVRLPVAAILLIADSPDRNSPALGLSYRLHCWNGS